MNNEELINFLEDQFIEQIKEKVEITRVLNKLISDLDQMMNDHFKKTEHNTNPKT